MKYITVSPSDLPYTLVNFGVDTLYLNVRYADENGVPVRSELCDEFVETLNGWQALAREKEELVPVSTLEFRGANLLMHPHGAGKGQWRWLLTSDAFNLCIGRGRLNGIIAQVRLSSRLLWSSEHPETHEQDLWKLLEEIKVFLTHALTTKTQTRLYLQVSEIHLCADIAGWDVSKCFDWQATMLTRARRRVPRGSYTLPEPDDCQEHGCQAAGSFLWQGSEDDIPTPIYNGHRLETIEFGSHGSTLSCVIYDKLREITTSGKTWMLPIWAFHGHDGKLPVARVEFRWKREALHNLKQEGVFHGIESLADLKQYLPYLWTYSAGHVQGGKDGLPDGWLRYVIPTNDKTVSRWPVHPAWLIVQSAFTTCTTPAVNVETGEFIAEYPVSLPLAELIRDRHIQFNRDRLARQVSGCCSTLAAFLTPRDAAEPLTFDDVFVWLMETLPTFLSTPELDKQQQRKDLSLEELRRLLQQQFDNVFLEAVREKLAKYHLRSVNDL